MSESTITQAELKRKKVLAEAILEHQGTHIDQFMYEQYCKIIDKNAEVLVKLVRNAPKTNMGTSLTNYQEGE